MNEMTAADSLPERLTLATLREAWTRAEVTRELALVADALRRAEDSPAHR